MVVGELQVDDVVAGLRGTIGNVEGTVSVVFTLDFSFARTFDGQRQSSVTYRVKTVERFEGGRG